MDTVINVHVARPHLSQLLERALLEDSRTDVLVSAAGAWEIATTYRLGKLPGAERIVMG